jgi:elongation factor G
MYCDDLAEAYLAGRETEDQIRTAVRTGVLSLDLTPVFVGTAYKNKGVQPLLDAVVDYLPSPADRRYSALDLDNNETEVPLSAQDDKPTVALAFKLEDGHYGQLTYIRIYQGSLKKGDELTNSRSGKSFKVGRLVRMHASDMEDIQTAPCGDIVALFGIDCASGDTFSQGNLNYSLTSMFVPDPVISLAIKPRDNKSADNMSKALNRFCKEDPTFHSFVDPESKETIIRGMGELHLDIYIERMKREYNVEIEAGMPQVAYRETITQRVEFDYTHKKQSGGSGQYGRVAGIMEPAHGSEYEFVDEITGGAIPREFISSCDKGFKACLARGKVIGFPIVGAKITINDGQSHPVDSSDMAFQLAAIGAFRQAYDKAKPEILEPIMKVSIEGPAEFQGNALASINQRRGIIISTSEDNTFSRVDAEVPLSEMFGYSTILRSMTQGKANFTMEFARYGKVPAAKCEELVKQYQEQAKKRA